MRGAEHESVVTFTTFVGRRNEILQNASICL